jgi:hypothetical protein
MGDEPMNESFYFTTTYEGDTDTYFAQRTQEGYSITISYKNCEASVDLCYNEVVHKLNDGEWCFV